MKGQMMKKIVAILMFGVALLWANDLARAEEEAKQMQKCEANDAEACFKVEEFEKACDLGLAKACVEGGERRYGRESITLGLPLFKKACEFGDMEGCKKALDRMINWQAYWRSYERDEDYSDERYKQELEQARVLLRKLCFDDGVETMCSRATYQMTNIDERGKVSIVAEIPLFSGDEIIKFEQKFNELFKISLQEDSKKCDEGEIEICLVLGKSYLSGRLDGISVDKNPTKAREFFQKACDAGDTDTCKKYELTQDTSKFKAILQKACDSGNQNACPRLGELYFGESKNTSKDKAKELYQKACDLGSANGCYELAVSYNIGRGVSQDINKAKELYKKACDLEESSACENFKRLSK